MISTLKNKLCNFLNEQQNVTTRILLDNSNATIINNGNKPNIIPYYLARYSTDNVKGQSQLSLRDDTAEKIYLIKELNHTHRTSCDVDSFMINSCVIAGIYDHNMGVILNLTNTSTPLRTINYFFCINIQHNYHSTLIIKLLI